MTSLLIDRRRFLGGAAAGALAGALPLPAIAAKTPVKFGMLTPLSGSGAAYGPNMIKATKLIADQINASGGILGGRQIEIVPEDSETNPTAAVRAARKLLDIDRVDALVGLWGSGPTMAVKPLAIEKGVSVSCLGAADAITEGDNKGLVWRFQSTGREWAVPAARAILAAGHRKVGILAVQTAFTQSMMGTTFTRIIEEGGGDIVVEAQVKPDQPSFRAEVDKVMGGDATAVFLPAYVAQFTAIAKEWYRGGYDAELYTLTIAASAGANGDGRFIKAVGKEVGEGINHFQPTNDTEAPAYKAFETLMGVAPGSFLPFSALCADTMAIHAAAMEKAGTSDATVYTKEIPAVSNRPGAKVTGAVELLKAVRAGADTDYVGYAMDIEFAANGDLKERPFAHFVIKDGKDVQIGTI